MLKRIITSLVALCVLLPVLFFADTIVLCIAVAIATIIELFELLRCMGLHKKLQIAIPVYLFACTSPFLVRYMENMHAFALIAFIIGALYLLYLFTNVILSHGKFPFDNVLAMMVLAVYIIAAMSSIVYIHDFGEMGKYIYLLIFIGAWITDIFAYFTGMLLGKHKLIPDVSPKKTVEGSIGGIVFCSLCFVLFGIVIDAFFDGNANLIFLALSGVIVSVISQVGDLIMSVIKRHYGIKDYGKLFPGHGGMLDRFDSILAVSLGLCAICMFMSLTGIQII